MIGKVARRHMLHMSVVSQYSTATVYGINDININNGGIKNSRNVPKGQFNLIIEFNFPCDTLFIF